MHPTKPLTVLALSIMAAGPAVAAEIPATIAVPGEILVATVHAEGAQVYECKTDASGKHAWQFREPIATLLMAGRTVGRHYAGPHWEMADGSVVGAKVSGRAPSVSASDIPLLRLDVSSHRGRGELSDVTTIQRLNTRGGIAEGACDHAGDLLSVPYTADYAFYRKRD